MTDAKHGDDMNYYDFIDKFCERKMKEENCDTPEAYDISKDLANEVCEYSKLRDEEWDFEEQHGDRVMWDDVANKEHDDLLGDIQKSREKLSRLCSRVLGEDVSI